MKRQIFLLVVSVLSFEMNGAFGCVGHVHTVDYANESNQVPQRCSCPCMFTTSERGYCPICGHNGPANRGEVTRNLMLELEGALLY